MQFVSKLLLCLTVGLLSGTGCSPADSVAETVPPAADEVTYFCRETRTFVRAPRQPTPAVNPATGRKTLVLAMYCPECRAWQAAPPAELRDRFPAGPMCRKHRIPLQETDAPKKESP